MQVIKARRAPRASSGLLAYLASRVVLVRRVNLAGLDRWAYLASLGSMVDKAIRALLAVPDSQVSHAHRFSYRCPIHTDRHTRRATRTGRSGATAGRTPTQSALVGRSGRLSSHRHTRHDKTVLSMPCLVCRRESDDCCERVQTSSFLSATVASRRGSNSHRRGRHDADRAVLSCVLGGVN